jgi:hypothetical protein
LPGCVIAAQSKGWPGFAAVLKPRFIQVTPEEPEKIALSTLFFTYWVVLTEAKMQ